MKFIKTFFSIVAFLVMLCSISVMTSAAWKTENGSRYYYSNGTKYTGGPKTINGKKYLFKPTGELIINQVTNYKNKIYVSKADGTLLTDWGSFGKNKYYGRSYGHCRKGLQKYKKNYYYFDPTTAAMVKKTLVQIGSDYYYFQSSGKAAKSKWITLSTGKYYFGSDGKVLHGPQRIGKYYYLLGKKTGKMQTGSVKYGKYYYYLDPKTGRALTNGWKTIKGKKYYYNNVGRRVTGWLILGKKRYYLDPKQKGARVTGTKVIDGKTYKFGSKGYIKYKPSGNIVVKVNKKSCVVTVYDNNVPIKAMLCSPGRSGHETPSGVFTVKDHLAWWVLDGPSYGQYCSHFLSEYLFHSVPMHTTVRDPYKVEANDYNCLGSPASGGCIRLSVADAKWIYYNVPVGSTVVISNSEATPLGKPAPIRMPKRSVGADPTDDFKNPAGYDVRIK